MAETDRVRVAVGRPCSPGNQGAFNGGRRRQAGCAGPLQRPFLATVCQCQHHADGKNRLEGSRHGRGHLCPQRGVLAWPCSRPGIITAFFRQTQGEPPAGAALKIGRAEHIVAALRSSASGMGRRDLCGARAVEPANWPDQSQTGHAGYRNCRFLARADQQTG